MIERLYITGDTHGDFSRFRNYGDDIKEDYNVAVIILGDAAFNYYMNERDSQWKNKIMKKYAFTIYCVRGNHEARPQDIEDMILEYDPDVDGEVYYQPQWPRIKYFKDYGVYHILGKKFLVIGGAYSIDKDYRLQKGYSWFPNEQLSSEEMADCFAKYSHQDYDVILTHTCPISWEPTDLFLSGIVQSKVDKSMERFLEGMKDSITWKIWLFGHFHADRAERPGVEMFYRDTDNFLAIWQRWMEKEEPEWWIEKAPAYYEGV